MDHALKEALYLFNTGKNEKAYDILGAHPHKKGGFVFRVWAPQAKKVFLLGDFNLWDKTRHIMKLLEGQGVWELYVPEAQEGQFYKYLVEDAFGVFREKADPYAQAQQLRPNTASVLYTAPEFLWEDEAYLKSRPVARANNFPLNIYEVHFGSWKRHPDGSFFTFVEMAHELGTYLLDMGYTHVELMPIMEHPLDASWGYQVTGFFATTARFGKLHEFQYFVNHLHKLGIGVILDWVPAHFPKDDWALASFDGLACYEHPDPFLGEQPEWGTKIFDFARTQVKSFLFSSAFFWLEKCHLDGLRFDAVSTILYRNYAQETYSPNIHGGRENLEGIAFLRELCSRIEEKHPQILLMAEESTTFPQLTSTTKLGGIGFNYKWDMGWMHDTLKYFSRDYIYRPWHHNEITFSMSYAFSERFLLPFSHDEVVHGKKSLIDRMQGDIWRKFASLRTLYAYMIGHPGAKLLFMGGEFAQFIEWRFYEELEWFLLKYPLHDSMKAYVKHLNHLYRKHPVFWELDTNWQGFQWCEANDAKHCTYSFVREDAQGNQAYFVLNMLPDPVYDYSLPVHQEGELELWSNSDDLCYSGSGFDLGPNLIYKKEDGLQKRFIYTVDFKKVKEKENKVDKPNIQFHLPALSCLIFYYPQKQNLPSKVIKKFSLQDDKPVTF